MLAHHNKNPNGPLYFLQPLAASTSHILSKLPLHPTPAVQRSTCRALAIFLVGWAKIFGKGERDWSPKEKNKRKKRHEEGMVVVEEKEERGIVRALAGEVLGRVEHFSPLHLAIAVNSLALLEVGGERWLICWIKVDKSCMQAHDDALMQASAARGVEWLRAHAEEQAFSTNGGHGWIVMLFSLFSPPLCSAEMGDMCGLLGMTLSFSFIQV